MPLKRKALANHPEGSEAHDGAPQKPPPSFGGALSKFVYSTTTAAAASSGGGSSRTTRSSARILSASASSRAATATPNPANPPKTAAASTSTAAPKPNNKDKAEDAASTKEKNNNNKKKKKRRTPSVYAPPSTYAHLPPIPDALAPNLLVLFIGINPGLTSAATGHAFAAPSNLFYKLLHSSGCTPDRRVAAREDQELPRRYALGHTNLVGRPSRDAGELSRAEMAAGVARLREKVRRWAPEAVCFVGKVVWETVVREGTGRGVGKGWGWGWQEGAAAEGWGAGGRVFVVPSTSGLVAGYSWEFKRELWTVLGDWVQERRRARGEEEGAALKPEEGEEEE
ncbi:uracil-DNA glycosylase-like protein [Morchella snyderi]|nr:uracil-DNA glycosylase-like protein [Morchella snyderi]